MSAFTLSRPAVEPRLGLQGTLAHPASMTDAFRPRQFSAMVGQGEAVWQLQSFLDAPHSAAFLFTGPTGVGKTTAALCLAAELGAVEFGGLDTIKSGMQDAEAVDGALYALRHTPMLGSGWKVIIVDEADYMSQKAAQLWLSALEDLPPRSVVVFTTNKADKFPDRFLDRCERIEFAGDAMTLMQDAQALVDDIWHAETGRHDAPRVANLPGIVDGDGKISFRRVVRAIEPLARRSRREDGAGRTREREAMVVSVPEPDAVGVKPCTACGTKGGGIEARTNRPWRAKGTCRECYNRQRSRKGGNNR